jgi:hypothetical protein
MADEKNPKPASTRVASLKDLPPGGKLLRISIRGVTVWEPGMTPEVSDVMHRLAMQKAGYRTGGQKQGYPGPVEPDEEFNDFEQDLAEPLPEGLLPSPPQKQ